MISKSYKNNSILLFIALQYSATRGYVSISFQNHGMLQTKQPRYPECMNILHSAIFQSTFAENVYFLESINISKIQDKSERRGISSNYLREYNFAFVVLFFPPVLLSIGARMIDWESCRRTRVFHVSDLYGHYTPPMLAACFALAQC